MLGRLFQRWVVNGANNYVRQVAFDNLNRLQNLYVINTGVTQQSDTFSYDAVNNITKINHVVDSNQHE